MVDTRALTSGVNTQYAMQDLMNVLMRTCHMYASVHTPPLALPCYVNVPPHLALQADSPQRFRSQQDGSDSVVDAAQFAESMVPEGLHGAALPRNSSQTSLSGAAPGGVLDTGPHSAALPRSSSQVSLPRVMSSGALHIGPHGKAMPRTASSSTLVGAGPTSAPLEADQGPNQRAQGSNFRWPWQAKKPGGAVRQLQPSHQSNNAIIHSSVTPQAVTQAAGVDQCNSPSPAQVDSSNQPGSDAANSGNQAGRAATEQDHPGDGDKPKDEAQGEAGLGQAGKRSRSNQASGLADRALNKIAAAQQDMHQAAPLQDAASWMKSNAGSPASPRSSAFSQPTSPQHNSRLRACAKSDRLRQLIRDGSLPRQQPECESGSAEGTEPRGRATQGLVTQPSHSSAGLADVPVQPKGKLPTAVEQQHCLRDTQGSAKQPLEQDMPEGPHHAENPGSQAAAVGADTDPAEASRYDAAATEHM